MSDIKVGDQVTWLYMDSGGIRRRKGTVTEIDGDKARVAESDGYYREHQLGYLRVVPPDSAQPAVSA